MALGMVSGSGSGSGSGSSHLVRVGVSVSVRVGFGLGLGLGLGSNLLVSVSVRVRARARARVRARAMGSDLRRALLGHERLGGGALGTECEPTDGHDLPRLRVRVTIRVRVRRTARTSLSLSPPARPALGLGFVSGGHDLVVGGQVHQPRPPRAAARHELPLDQHALAQRERDVLLRVRLRVRVTRLQP